MKKLLVTVLKTLLTIGIFVSLFVEFGGGKLAVSRPGFAEGTIFYRANPALPGLLGRLEARLGGATLPDRYLPLPGDQVCALALKGDSVFVRAESGEIAKLRATHHCVEGRLARVLAGPESDEMVPLASQTGASVFVEKQGMQRVPMTMADLWTEVKGLDFGVFVPWILFATVVKLLGIFANIVRWKVLLSGQSLHFGFGWLTASYFVGRFFGIVMPSTLGLDGWRLYDSIRLSGRPVECTTVLAVERVIGLVGLLATILLFMPFADLGGRDLADVVQAMALPLAGAMLFGFLLLIRPELFTPLIRLMPVAKVRGFLRSTIQSATAYSSRRGALLVALACAVFGQLTTMAMYFGNAMALGVAGVTLLQVFYAAAVMTLGTFVTPTAAGEGVRELVFVELLGGHIPAAQAFLIGHIGFWIEKLLLSFQGGIFLLWAPKSYQRATREEIESLRAAAQRGAPAFAAEALARDAEPAAPPLELSRRLRLCAGLGLGSGVLAGLLVAAAESFVIAREGFGTDAQVLWYAPLAYAAVLGALGLAGGLGLALLRFGEAQARGWTPSLVWLATLVPVGLAITLFRLRRDVFLEQTPPLPVLAAVLAGFGLLALLLLFLGPRLFRGRLGALVRPLPALALLALAVAAGALAAPRVAPAPGERPPAPGVPAALAKRPNILLVMVDTLRADHLSCYGAREVETPALCSLARDGGTRFDGYSHASWTKPSTASLITSLLPSTHGAVAKTSVLPAEVETLAEALAQGGYATGGIASNINLAPSFGFDQGYGEYHYLGPDYLAGARESSSKLILYQIARSVWFKLRPGLRVGDFYQDAATVNAVAFDFLERHRASRFFLFLHYMDPHDPYFEHPYDGRAIARVSNQHPDPKLADEMKRLYRGEVRYLEAHFAELLAKLRALGLYDDALIVLTADHGEEFHEHGGFWHGLTLYDEQIRVPLLVKWPQGAPGAPAEVLGHLSRHLDVAPTLLARAGIAPPAAMQGIDLASAAAGRAEKDLVSLAEEDHEGNVLRALRGSEWKLIEANPGNPRGLAPEELYQVGKDPGETRNLIAEQPARAGLLRAQAEAKQEFARRRAAGAAGAAELSRAQQEALRALGYVE
jgi:arylsulfatase A-like enzyme